MKLYLSIILILCLFSSNAQKFTENHGRLQVIGTQLCDKNKQAIQLKGFSTHNTTFCPECVTEDAIKSNSLF